MSLIHQRQPTRTSCGPTTVAMLVGLPAHEAIDALRKVRSVCRRRSQRRSERTNVGELRRLLDGYGWRLGKRRAGMPGHGPAVLRVEHPVGRGWHWSLFSADGRVFDPATECRTVRGFTRGRLARVSHYDLAECRRPNAD